MNAIRPDAVKVILTAEQMERASSMGRARQLAAIRNRRPGFYGNSNEDAWTQHIEGCGGEYAGCLHYGLPWNALLARLNKNGVRTADSSDRVEFRTRLKYNYELIVHPEDVDERAFVLVVGLMPVYFIQGWLTGREAKQDQWWSDPSQKNRPAYFIPTSYLHSPDTLRNWLNGKEKQVQ